MKQFGEPKADGVALRKRMKRFQLLFVFAAVFGAVLTFTIGSIIPVVIAFLFDGLLVLWIVNSPWYREMRDKGI
jgi:hypothetical protein